jgi:hypothetical protein
VCYVCLCVRYVCYHKNRSHNGKTLNSSVAYAGNFFGGGGGGVSTKSVEDRGQRERGLGTVAP